MSIRSFMDVVNEKPNRFENLLLELTNAPYPFDKINDTPSLCTYRFSTDYRNTFRVMIVDGGDDDRTEENVAHIIFSEYHSHETSITGKGDQFRIFATVLNIIKSYVGEKHPAYLEFSSSLKEPSRLRLYDQFTKRLSSILPYKLLYVKEIDGSKTWLFDRENNLNERRDDTPLLEIADNPYRYIRRSKTARGQTYLFQTDDKRIFQVSIQVDASRTLVTFADRSNGINTKQTGMGDPFRVFATVIDIVKTYVGQSSPASFEFSATLDEPQRVRLYDRFASRVSSVIPGYHLASIKTVNQNKEWTFERDEESHDGADDH